MNKVKQFSIEILNDFVNILITDVSNKYLKKLKKDKKNPHKLIEDYLDQAVILSEKGIIIWNNNHISTMNDEIRGEFNYWIEQDKEYKNLVNELNFAFNLIKSEKLQFKVLNSLYETFNKSSVNENVCEYKKYKNTNINFDINSVLRKEFNKNKKIMNELNYF